MHGVSMPLSQPYPAPPKLQQGDIQTVNDVGTAPATRLLLSVPALLLMGPVRLREILQSINASVREVMHSAMGGSASPTPPVRTSPG